VPVAQPVRVGNELQGELSCSICLMHVQRQFAVPISNPAVVSQIADPSLLVGIVTGLICGNRNDDNACRLRDASAHRRSCSADAFGARPWIRDATRQTDIQGIPRISDAGAGPDPARTCMVAIDDLRRSDFRARSGDLGQADEHCVRQCRGLCTDLLTAAKAPLLARLSRGCLTAYQ